MQESQGRLQFLVRVALVLSVTVLPVALVIGTGIWSRSEQAPIWQFALQLCLFVCGGSVALIAVLVAQSVSVDRRDIWSRFDRWVAGGIYGAVLVAALLWREHLT